MSKAGLFAAGGLLVLLGAAASVAYLKSKPKELDRVPAAHGRSRSIADDSKLAQLQATVERLQTRVTELEAPTTASAAPGNTPAPSERGSAPPERTPERIKAERGKLMERLRELNQSFQAEQRDGDWATQMEGRISSALQQESFGKTTVVSSSCRSSLCRVEARHEDRASSDAFELLRREIDGNFYLQHINPDDLHGDGTLRTVVYFVRPGRERDNALYDVMYGE